MPESVTKTEIKVSIRAAKPGEVTTAMKTGWSKFWSKILVEASKEAKR